MSSSISSSNEYTRSSKLKTFFKEDAAALKRLKCVITWKSSVQPHERTEFHELYCALIYKLVLDVLQKYDFAYLSKRESVNMEEACEVVDVFYQMMEDIRDKLQRRWQARSIANMIVQMIDYDNVHAIREKGIVILLKFLDILNANPAQASADKEGNTALLKAFGSCVNFLPCAHFFSEKVKTALEVDAIRFTDGFSFAKRGAPQTESETIQLLRVVLNFIKNASNVDFWAKAIYENLFPQLYPFAYDGVSTIKIEGFKPTCPAIIQREIVHFFHLLTINSSSAWRNAYDNDGFVKLIIEVLRQSCILPPSFIDAISLSVEIYNFWITSAVRMPPLIAGNTQFYIQVFIESIFSIFEVNSDGEINSDSKHMDPALSKKLALCSSAIQVYRNIAHQKSLNLSPKTWEKLLVTLINVANLVFQSALEEKTSIDNIFSDIAFETLFDCFISASLQDIILWTALQEKFTKWVQNKGIVLLWSKRMILYTQNLIKDVTEEGGRIEATFEKSKSADKTIRSLSNVSLDHSFSVRDFIAWDRFLHLFGDPMEIEYRDNKLIVIDAVINSFTLWIDAIERPRVKTKEEKIMNAGKWESSAVPREFLPRGNTLLSLYAPYLFHFAKSHDLSRETIRIKSCLALCRLFSMRFDEAIEENFVHVFFGIVYEGLVYGSLSVKSAIILGSKNLFSVGIEGIDLLIPDYVEICTEILCREISDENVAKSALSILQSFIPLSIHYEDVTLEDLETVIPPENEDSPEYKKRSITVSSSRPVNYKEVQKLLLKCFMSAVKSQNFENLRITSMWSIFSLISHVSLCRAADGKFLEDCISVFIPFLSYAEQQHIGRVSIEIIRSLSHFHDLLSSNSVQMIIRGICGNAFNVAHLLKKNTNVGNQVDLFLAELIYCLIDWVMVIGSSMLEEHSSNNDVFALLETCMSITASSESTAKFTQLRDAALTAIHYCVGKVDNFPNPEGIDISSSLISETNDPDDDTEALQISDETALSSHIFLVFKNSCLVSLSDRSQISTSGKLEKVSRMIIRDFGGKSCWDFKMVNPSDVIDLLFQNEEQRKSETIESIRFSSTNEILLLQNAADSSEAVEEKACSSGCNSSQDLLGTVLNLIESEFPQDSLIQPLYKGDFGLSLELSNILPQSVKDESSRRMPEIMSRMDLLMEQEKQSAMHKMNSKEEITDRMLSHEAFFNAGPFDHSRLLLAHLSWISHKSEEDGDLKILERNDKLLRSLKLLDQIYSRECHKIGVIFVKEGQEHQRVILQNDKGSEMYEKFVDGIGWNIDVTKHRGFLGGLDPRHTTGKYAPYWANATTEIIFHVASRMPTNPSDPQQIHKKRQVGNDHVHIVWSEHSRDYLPSTISSSFNDVHIVIYPLTNRLYRIQIHAKDKVPPFGPLQSGMIVSESVLVPLVRITALNANRAVRFSTPGYDRPFPTRKKPTLSILLITMSNTMSLFPLDSSLVHLNHGSYGCAPVHVEHAASRLRDEASRSYDDWFRVVSRRYWARAVHALDQLVHSPCADAIVFVENATAAVNTVLNSHVWNNIVCFDVTYAAVKKAVLHQVQSKRATHMEILGFIEREDKSLDLSKQALLTQIEQTCCRLQSQGVNLLIVDHISSCPAFVYPVRDIVKVARKYGFLVLIDGAHAVGQVDINLAEIDCDFYCSNLHKWFFAPKSSAFLYVKPEHQAKTLPLFISHEFGSGSFQKQFYMVGTRDYIPYFTIHASIDFIDNVIGGFDVLKRKNSKLMADAIELFKLKWKTDPISPILNYCSSDDDSDSPTLLCAPFLLTIELPFSYADYVKVFSESFASPMKFESKLEEELVQMTSHEGLNLMQHLYQKYRIQTITFHGRSKFWARISVQIYNSISDYEALAQAILDIKKQIDQALSK